VPEQQLKSALSAAWARSTLLAAITHWTRAALQLPI